MLAELDQVHSRRDRALLILGAARDSAARRSGHQDPPLPDTDSAEPANSNDPSNISLVKDTKGSIEGQLRPTTLGPGR